MRYIDADKFAKQAYEVAYPIVHDINSHERGLTLMGITQLLDDQPIADVRENINGNWIKRIDHLDYGLIEFEGFECSLCGVKIWKDDYENIEFKFCPNCGAKMKNEE